MLYLMLDKRNNQFFAKVGMAKRPSERRRAYSTHNPCAIMRSTCAGTGNEENLCRSALSKRSIRRIGSTEWFEVTEEVFTLLYENGMGFLRPKQKPIHFLEKFS